MRFAGKPRPNLEAARWNLLAREDPHHPQWAELFWADAAMVREQLEAATGERIAALEAVETERTNGREAAPDDGRNTGDGMEPGCAVGRYGRAEDPRTEDPGTRTRPVTRPDRAQSRDRGSWGRLTTGARNRNAALCST